MKNIKAQTKSVAIFFFLILIVTMGKAQEIEISARTNPSAVTKDKQNGVDFTLNEGYLTRPWQMIDLGGSIGSAGMQIKDLDNDSIDEIIVTGNTGHLHILKYNDEQYYDAWCRKIPSGIVQFIIEDLDNDLVDEIYVMSGDSELYCYKSDSMSILYTQNFNFSSVKKFQIADIDDDSTFEIIISSSDYSGDGMIAVYNLDTFEEEWVTTAFGSYDFEISDVDDDGIQEIVLSEGVIFDGFTHEIDWQYNEEFGRDISLSDIDNDGVDEIIGLSYSSITAFDGINNTPIWQFTTLDASDCFLVCDLEGDGIEEIITGGNQWGEISCYSSETHQLLWSIDNPEHGVTNIAIGDPDGDEVLEVMWGAGASSSGADNLFIASTEYFQIEWQSMDMDGPFYVSVGDLESDDLPEIFITSNESNSGYDGGNLLIFDGLNYQMINYLENLSGWGGLNLVKSGNINNTPQSEIIVGMSNNLIILDGSNFQQLFTSTTMGSINTLEILDIDNDNVTEIILGSSDGKVYILNGEDFSIEWQSINTGSGIGLLRVDDCDNDGELEIIFHGNNNILQVYGAETHYLEWQSVNISDISSFDISDLDRNGTKEFVISNEYGDILLVNCETHNIILDQNVSSEATSYLEVAPIDSSAFERILILNSRLQVLNGLDMSLIWESEIIGQEDPYYTPKGNIHVCDIDMNQKMDILVGNIYGVIQYECSIPYPDITPPTIKQYNPESDFTNASIDIQMQVLFSEEISTEQSIIDNIALLNNNNETIEFDIQYTYNEDISQLLILPQNLLNPDDEITVTISGLLTDTSENGLDGNGNGISEGSPLDDFSWSFFTGTGIDTIPPEHVLIQVEPDTLWKGINVTLDAIFSDSSSYAMSPIIAAEIFIDELGANGEGIPLPSIDGYLNSVYEVCSKVINTENFSNGEHTIYVHAKDLCGNWSAFESVELYILTEMQSNWNMYSQNAQHTSYNPSDTTKYPLKFKWSKNLSSNRLYEPIIINNSIYTTSGGGWSSPSSAYGINLFNGEIIWETNLGNAYTITGPSFGYGTVFLQVGIDNDYGTSVYAFDAITGNEIWASPFGSQWEEYLPPTIYDNKVLINGGHYGGAYAFHVQTGQEIWFHDLTQYDSWTPAAYNGIVYTFTGGSYYANLVAINANTGITIWEKTDIPYDWGGYSMNTAPVIDTSNKIIFVTSDDYIHAINIETQNVVWYKSGSFGTSPALGSTNIYIINNGQLNVYDKITGNLQWTCQNMYGITTPPILSNGHVILSSEQQVKIFNIASHDEVWSFDHGGKIAVGNSHLILSTNDGVMYCFESDLSIGINDNPLQEDMTLSPNPTKDFLKVSFPSRVSDKMELSIFNSMGQSVLSEHFPSINAGYDFIRLDVSSFNKGIYILNIEASQNTYTKKFVVE